MRINNRFIAGSWLLLVISIGCQSSTTTTEKDSSDQPASEYLLSAEPADPMTPTEVKEKMTGPAQVAIAGRIDAGQIEPFQQGMATFVMTQLPDSSHAGGDAEHADNCPFCQRKLRNAPKVVVQILDADGQIVPVDARKLLGVSKGDVVVVQGQATFQEAVNTVEMNAAGIYLRPKT